VERPDEKLAVATARGAALVNVREIDWIQSEGNYARLWSGQQSYLIREPLRLLEKQVHASDFVRAAGAGPAQQCTRSKMGRRGRAGFLSAVRRLGTMRGNS